MKLKAILNLFFAIALVIADLIAFSVRSQTYSTPQSGLEALYNLFIRGNIILPILLVYILLSMLYLKRVLKMDSSRRRSK